MFNVVVDLLAFAFLLPLLPALLNLVNLQDPLYSLALFHSTFNLLGLALFIPVLRPYANWIEQRFNHEQTGPGLHDVPLAVPEASIKACQAHTQQLIANAITINLRNLHLDLSNSLSPQANNLLLDKENNQQSFERRYESLKQSEGELLRYILKLQQQPLNAE